MSKPKQPASIEQAATILQVHPATVRRMISRGELRAYRIGPRLLRVDLAEVQALLRPIPTIGGASA